MDLVEGAYFNYANFLLIIIWSQKSLGYILYGNNTCHRIHYVAVQVVVYWPDGWEGGGGQQVVQEVCPRSLDHYVHVIWCALPDQCQDSSRQKDAYVPGNVWKSPCINFNLSTEPYITTDNILCSPARVNPDPRFPLRMVRLARVVYSRGVGSQL